jgi:hypothetical protein
LDRIVLMGRHRIDLTMVFVGPAFYPELDRE